MLGYIVTLHCYVRLLRYRLWSAATLGVPGSKSRRLFSSRDRLSLLNISVAPGKCSFWQVPNLSNDVWYGNYYAGRCIHVCHLVILEMSWCDWKTQFKTLDLGSLAWKVDNRVGGEFHNFNMSRKNGKFKYFPHQKLTAELEKVHPNISSSTRFM